MDHFPFLYLFIPLLVYLVQESKSIQEWPKIDLRPLVSQSTGQLTFFFSYLSYLLGFRL